VLLDAEHYTKNPRLEESDQPRRGFTPLLFEGARFLERPPTALRSRNTRPFRRVGLTAPSPPYSTGQRAPPFALAFPAGFPSLSPQSVPAVATCSGMKSPEKKPTAAEVEAVRVFGLSEDQRKRLLILEPD
jgi:hypothetical protein